MLGKEGIGAFIKKASLFVSVNSMKFIGYVFDNSLGYIFSPFIMNKFKNSVRDIDNIHNVLGVAFSFRAFGVSIKPTQVEYEIAKLLEIMAELGPKVVLEIGTALGGTLFLFIDGDHTYEGVKKDFEMYSPLIRKGGFIAFHDIVPGPPGNVGGVPEFWKEIKHHFNFIEIVKDWRQEEYGIGILYIR
jgi:hypothetical protein